MRSANDGAFNTIGQMVSGRKQIRDTVLRRTVYTRIQKNDFGYALSDTAQLRIGELAQYAIDDVRRILSEIDQRTLQLLQAKVIRVDDFFERDKILENIEREIGNVWKSAVIHSISSLSDKIAVLSNALNLTIDSKELRQICRNEENLAILKSMVRFEIKVPIDDYVSKSFARTFKYIKREHNWSEFLVNVYNFFVGYEIQKDVSFYNVRELNDWKIRDKPQDLYLSEKI